MWIVVFIISIYTIILAIKTYKKLQCETIKRIQHPKTRKIKRAYISKDEFEQMKQSILQKKLP